MVLWACRKQSLSSNSLAENTINLLWKGTKNGSGPSIGLLNLRNVPKDQTLGSPSRRLMSSRTSFTILVAN